MLVEIITRLIYNSKALFADGSTKSFANGTTTHLTLKVLSEREESTKGRSIQILDRNEPPMIICEICGKPATQVCSQCKSVNKGWLCDKCAERHECGDDMLLPVVNSLRVGICGYTGK